MTSYFSKKNEIRELEIEQALEKARNALMTRVSNYLQNYKPFPVQLASFEAPVVLNG